MEIVYFTLAAILLYFVADWALDRIERALGHRLEYRSIYFFAILASMAVVGFWAVRQLTTP